MKADILTIFPGFFTDRWITASPAGPARWAWRKSKSTICGSSRTTGTAPWMTALSAAARAWCSSRNRSLNVWNRCRLASREQRLAGGCEGKSVILLSAQGQRFTQKIAAELATLDRMVLICGRYEGVDERVADFLADRELSIGDYVLSGGELAAAVIIEAVMRLLPGAVGNEASTRQESFTAHGGSRRGYGKCRGGFDLRLRRIARLSALHAPRGFSRDDCTGSFAERRPPGNSPLAPSAGSGKNAAQPSGFSGGCAAERGRRKDLGPHQGRPRISCTSGCAGSVSGYKDSYQGMPSGIPRRERE